MIHILHCKRQGSEALPRLLDRYVAVPGSDVQVGGHASFVEVALHEEILLALQPPRWPARRGSSLLAQRRRHGLFDCLTAQVASDHLPVGAY